MLKLNVKGVRLTDEVLKLGEHFLLFVRVGHVYYTQPERRHLVESIKGIIASNWFGLVALYA